MYFYLYLPKRKGKKKRSEGKQRVPYGEEKRREEETRGEERRGEEKPN